ncbi:MAG: nucleoside triphosphate pyrophosphohydrolase [Armatimonadota bacterium]|nr:nucleoside triphosphate pyrophosphohydrolase [Armatimonadota bacterium]MDR7455331.1 nucleoside triphosphate pyrophosphohydrolase [Armatimonadota bacterium]
MRFTFDDLIAVMARLRGPGGCPWDREQTHASLLPYLLEETHEVIDAVDRNDAVALREELGDLLLQVVFHAQMAAEAGGFTAGDVVDGLIRKLLERHPHVFGDARLGTPGEVLARWHELKQREAPHRGAFEGIPATLPALARAQKLVERAAVGAAEATRAAGTVAGARPATEAAAAEVRRRLDRLADTAGADAARERLGDLLLAVVALASAAGVDAESALREAGERFVAAHEAAR